jgi:hypothetical protein
VGRALGVQATAATTSPQTTALGAFTGRDVRAPFPQAGHLLPDQTQPILDFLRGCDPTGLDLDEDIQVLRRNECQGEDRRRG